MLFFIDRLPIFLQEQVDIELISKMDFDQLEHELNGMVAADNLYWERNDAKFRAAKQNVTYEQFEQIVKVSTYVNKILIDT